jgi:antirestriction protein ArdC
MSKRDTYQEVTDRIISALENGDADGKWSPPWVELAAQGIPSNAITRKRYRGVNTLNLWITAQQFGFKSSRWGTYRQWQSIGAQVRGGEKGTIVVFFKTFDRETDAVDSNGDAVVEQVPLIRHSTVFNAEQVDDDPRIDEDEPVEAPNGAEALAHLDEFLAATGAKIIHGGDSAHYAPGTDTITLPTIEQFHSTEGYYGTALHELTHWTGAEQRLDRKLTTRFGSDAYAVEELIAELGSSFLSAEFGVEAEPRADHAKYLSHWLKILRADKKAIVTAASRAADAAEFLRESAQQTESERTVVAS